MANRSCIEWDASTIPAVATSVLREMVRCCDADDTVMVETGRGGVCVDYISITAAHGARDLTRLRCRGDFQSGRMWVEDLRVARSLRLNGMGRRLVAAAEGIATTLGLQVVHVFPLIPATDFWKRMGYTPHPKTARVVKKDLAEQRVAANTAR